MDPELARILQEIGVSQPTADSIFSALGPPHKPIKIEIGGGGGQYKPYFDQITLDPQGVVLRAFFESMGSRPNVNASDMMGEILAHELSHQETFDASNSQYQGFENLFMEKFRSLPLQAKMRHHENYFGGNVLRREAIAEAQKEDENVYDVLNDRFDRLGERTDEYEMAEIIASTVERGFHLARRAGEQDISSALSEAEERLPGTLEAYNFWVRMLGGGE